jgi:hypothetical protein
VASRLGAGKTTTFFTVYVAMRLTTAAADVPPIPAASIRAPLSGGGVAAVGALRESRGGLGADTGACGSG